jgi:hypothetical protein
LIQGDNYSGVDKFTEQEIILNTPYIFTQRHGGGNTYLRVNGGPETSFAFGDATFNTAKKISVGAGNTAAANGYLGVLIGYNRSLTSTELDSLIAALRKKYFFLSSPQPFQCFQRSGATGAIAISGWSDITGDIEASFNGGAYQTIVARAVPGPFSGVLSGLTPGTGTLTVRAKSDLTKTTTVGNVMVGDVFILAGQSNPSGRGGSLQTYTASGSLKAAVFNNAYRWTEMKDWVDTNFNQIDVVSNEDPASSPAFGSVWPLVATRYLTNKGVPFAVVPACLGSTSITQHLPGANHQDRATLYGSLVYRALQVGGCKAVLWWQGETDMAAGMAQVNYSTHLNTLANALFADLGVPLIPCKLQHIDSRATEPQQAAINNAIGAAWGTGHILTGPDLSGLDCTNPAVSSDGVHVTTNGGLTSAANLWGAILEALT